MSRRLTSSESLNPSSTSSALSSASTTYLLAVVRLAFIVHSFPRDQELALHLPVFLRPRGSGQRTEPLTIPDSGADPHAKALRILPPKKLASRRVLRFGSRPPHLWCR